MSQDQPQPQQADPAANDGAPPETTASPATELAELRDRLLRVMAESENLRRRAARERDDAVRYAAANVIEDLLPTADSIRRAIESVAPERAAGDELLKNLLAGVLLTEKGLLAAFQKHDIRRIDPGSGEAFDPDKHQAILVVGDANAAAGTVSSVLQPGYAYHDRVLRPAMVGVVASDDRDSSVAEVKEDGESDDRF
jgi:molecular chaperone GrpE